MYTYQNGTSNEQSNQAPVGLNMLFRSLMMTNINFSLNPSFANFKHKIPVIVAIAAALLCSSPNAIAGDQEASAKIPDNGFYASFGISVGFENSVPVRVPSNSPYSNESFESKQTVAPNVAIGKSFSGAWRAEVEYVGYFADTALKATYGDVNYKNGGYMIDTNAFFFNIFKDFPTNTKFTSYIGLGIGPAFTRYSTPAVGSESGTSFAGQGKVGISYSASPKTDVYVGYRILGLTGGTKLGFWSDKPTTESSFQQSLDAGIRYKF